MTLVLDAWDTRKPLDHGEDQRLPTRKYPRYRFSRLFRSSVLIRFPRSLKHIGRFRRVNKRIDEQLAISLIRAQDRFLTQDTPSVAYSRLNDELSRSHSEHLRSL